MDRLQWFVALRPSQQLWLCQHFFLFQQQVFIFSRPIAGIVETVKNWMLSHGLLVLSDSLQHSQQFFSYVGMGKTCSSWVEPAHTNQELMFLAQQHNAAMPVRLGPATFQPQVTHSTTEPQRSGFFMVSRVRWYQGKSNIVQQFMVNFFWLF